MKRKILLGFKLKNRQFALLLAVIGLQTLSTTLSAKENNSDLTSLLNLSLEQLLQVKVNVASQFLESDLEVGSTVAQINEQEWQKRGARRLYDAIGHLPSTVALPNLFGAESLAIRSYSSVTSASRVATLWDGVPLNTLQNGTSTIDRPNIQLGTLDKIEMIRGPGSALYGEDAFYGVLSLSSFESKTDTKRFDSEVTSNGYYAGGLKYSTGIGKQTRINIATAFNGQPAQDRTYNYTDVNDNQQSSERDYKFLSKTATLKVASNLSNGLFYNLGFYWDDNDSDNFQGQGSDILDDADISSSESTFYMTRADFGKKLTQNTEIKFSAYYWNKEHLYERPLSNGGKLDASGDESQWSGNVTIKQSDLFGNTQWSAVIGTRFVDLKNADQKVTTPIGSVIDSESAFSGLDRRINSLALDASSRFLNNQISLLYGLRVDNYDDYGTQLSPRLSGIYHPTKDSAVKLLYGSAFRAPIGVEIAGATSVEGNEDIQPETIDTYELVLMKQARTWKIEMTFFRSEWNDAIELVDTTTTGKVGKFDNVGVNEATGMEGTLKLLIDKWTLDGSGSFVKSENKFTEKENTAFPKVIINGAIGYDFNNTSRIFVNNRVQLYANESPDDGSTRLPSYLRTDIHASKQFKRNWQLFLNIRNLLNRENFLPSLQGAEDGIPEESRSISIGFRYNQ